MGENLPAITPQQAIESIKKIEPAERQPGQEG